MLVTAEKLSNNLYIMNIIEMLLPYKTPNLYTVTLKYDEGENQVTATVRVEEIKQMTFENDKMIVNTEKRVITFYRNKFKSFRDFTEIRELGVRRYLSEEYDIPEPIISSMIETLAMFEETIPHFTKEEGK